MLNNLIKESIKRHALEESPKECCGILIKKENTLTAFPCYNVSEKPEKHFSILPSDYLKASRKGTVEAVYHSHNSNNDKFSPNDILNSKSHNLPFVLYCAPKDSFSTFDPEKSKTFWYDKTFKIGETDCYTVVKEYYKELGIELDGQNNLGNDWHKKNPELIQELFDLNKSNPNLPIIELPPNTGLKKHDVIVFQFVKGAGPNHVAIYLGNGEILHHPRNKFLCIQELNKTLRKTIFKIYRHEQFS
tara:strand:+ start:104 stop:841 length:738 start_codon:yes stop_codon:yes gene_type:complete